ncbi:MAG: hypothetical protein GEEBNDBF_02428 [bacterium]|nr:hypothetical protein [bacterium]
MNVLLNRRLRALGCCAVLLTGGHVQALASEPQIPWTLEALQATALARDPWLQSEGLLAAQQSAAEAQGRRRPAPSWSLELEDVLGSGDYTGLKSGSLRWSYSQDLEPGARRTARVQLAQQERLVAELELARYRHDLRMEVTAAWQEWLLAGSRRALAEQEAGWYGQMAEVVRQRVDAGVAAEVDYQRARIALEQSQLAIDRAIAHQALARAGLAQFAGVAPEEMVLEAATLPEPEPLAPLESWLKLMGTHPELRWMDARLGVLEATAVLQLAEGQSEQSWSVGITAHQDPSDVSFTGEWYWTWPRGNRQRDAAQVTRLEAARLVQEQASLALALERSLRQQYSRTASARQAITALESTLLPQAREVALLMREAYQAGKIGLISALDAEGEWFALLEERLELLEAWHEARLELQRTSGQPRLLTSSMTGEAL